MSSLVEYIQNFEYVPGETPFSNYQTPLTIGAGYLLSVFLLKQFMSSRERIVARIPAIVHNFNMLAISIICFAGIVYGMIDIVYVSKTFFERVSDWYGNEMLTFLIFYREMVLKKVLRI